MSDHKFSLYDSKSKIFCFSERGEETVRREFAENGHFDLYRIQSCPEAGALRAVDSNGEQHILYGPANGATVLLCEQEDAEEAFDKVISLWKNSGLDVPAALNTAELGSENISRHVTESLITQLGIELTQVSSNAIQLDKQIAVLREDLEDYRRSIDEAQLTQRLAGIFPALSFERKPSRSALSASSNVLTQLLPYPGSTLSAVAFNLSNVSSAEGILAVKLTAREDDSILAAWEIDSAELNDGWNNVCVEKRIATRFRFVDLHLQWKGFEDHAPRVHLTDAYGDTQGFALVSGLPMQNQMLALRVWTGNRFDDEVATKYAHFPVDQNRLQHAALYHSVPESILKTVEGLSVTGGDRKWLQAARDGIMVHPVSDSVSIAALTLSLTAPITEIALTASVENARSQPVLFRVVVLTSDSDEQQHFQKNADLRPQNALFLGDWEEVLPCTQLPLICKLSEASAQTKVLLMTKVATGDESFAHAWFRNIQTSC